MSSRKGQAAMEYLMTYGWALLALVIVIIALMATGAFNPSYLIAEECTLQPDLSCGGHLLYLDTGGTPILKFRVNNGLGYNIRISDIMVTTSDGTVYDAYSLNPSSVEIEQGTSVDVEMELGGLTAIKGETERLKVSLTYVSCAPEVNYDCDSSGPEHIVSGRIVARTEQETS
jgi:hypothetical protein